MKGNGKKGKGKGLKRFFTDIKQGPNTIIKRFLFRNSKNYYTFSYKNLQNKVLNSVRSWAQTR